MMNKTSLVFVAGLLFAVGAYASPGSELARRDYDRGNYDVALQKVQPLAESGDAAAQALLGLMYADGKGVPKDEALSWQWYWKAAVGGNTAAQLALVSIYRDGRGVAADADMSHYWQWKAASALDQSDRSKLEAEIARDATAPRKGKDAAPTLNQGSCKTPEYIQTGYGYHLTGEMQILFMLSADGSVLEASMPKSSNWTKLDHDILNSYAKSCTFVANKREGKSVSGLYSLPVTWSVGP